MRWNSWVLLLLWGPLLWGQTTSTAPADTKAQASAWLQRAGKEAAGIDDANMKLAVLGSLAQAWARAGDVEQFRAAIVALDKAARQHDEKTSRATDMYRFAGAMDLIPALVRRGHLDEAKRLCGEVRGGDGLNSALSAQQALATALVEAGEIEEAREIERSQPTGDAVAAVQWAIASGLGRAGKAADLAEATKTLKTPMRDTAYMALMRAQLRKNKPDAAKDTIQQLSAAGQLSAWAQLVAWRCQQKDFRGARESLAQIKVAAQFERMHLDLCFAQEQSGDLDGARATALAMAGQSQELPAFNLVSRALIKKGDEAGAKAFREKISPKLRARAEKDWRQILVMASAEAGDGKRAAAHLEEMPEPERNFTFYLAVAVAEHKSKDEAGYRKYLALAKAQADAPAQKERRATWYRQMAQQMAGCSDVDDALKLAEQAVGEKEKSETLAGVASGCMEAGMPHRAWAAVGMIPLARERGMTAAFIAAQTVRKGQTDKLGGWIDALPAALDRTQACLAAAEALIPPRRVD